MIELNNGRTANRKEFIEHYSNASEDIESGLTPPKHESLPLVAYYDYGLAHGRVTKISTGGVIGMAGKTEIINNPKTD